MSIYPNPANTLCNIQYSLAESANVYFVITDVTGRIVFSNSKAKLLSGTYQFAINTTELANGMYYIEMKTDETTITNKLLITK